MTPHEKAVSAINTRLERLQANLAAAKGEAAQQFLFQSIVVTVALAEGLTAYIKAVGGYAERRHAAVKQANEALGEQHAGLLNTGKELLEKLKANPTDRALRKEIERAQQGMEAVQKTLRRGANALQRDLAPSLAKIDDLAVGIRRFTEADTPDALNRVLETMIGHTAELFRTHPDLPAKDVVDPTGWENVVVAEVDQAVDFYDAYARSGYQALLALELMTMAVSENPPRTGAEAAQRGNDAVAQRVKELTARIAAA